MVRVIVDSRVRIDAEGELDEETIKELRAEFTRENPKRKAMEAAKIKGWWNEPRVIATWGEERGLHTFPRGRRRDRHGADQDGRRARRRNRDSAVMARDARIRHPG